MEDHGEPYSGRWSVVKGPFQAMKVSSYVEALRPWYVCSTSLTQQPLDSTQLNHHLVLRAVSLDCCSSEITPPDSPLLSLELLKCNYRSYETAAATQKIQNLRKFWLGFNLSLILSKTSTSS